VAVNSAYHVATLEPGKFDEHELERGQARFYQPALAAGQHLIATADHRDIITLVRVCKPGWKAAYNQGRKIRLAAPAADPGLDFPLNVVEASGPLSAAQDVTFTVKQEESGDNFYIVIPASDTLIP